MKQRRELSLIHIYAEHIASLYDLMERDLRDGDALGVLRIGCSITIGSQLMPDYVRRFSEFYPGLEVYVHIERSEWLEEAVLRNAVSYTHLKRIKTCS